MPKKKAWLLHLIGGKAPLTELDRYEAARNVVITLNRRSLLVYEHLPIPIPNEAIGITLSAPQAQPHGWHTLDIECKGVLSIWV